MRALLVDKLSRMHFFFFAKKILKNRSTAFLHHDIKKRGACAFLLKFCSASTNLTILVLAQNLCGVLTRPP